MVWGYYPDWGGMFLMMVLSNILWIALLGLLVWAVIRWFIRRASAPGSGEPAPSGNLPSAQEILRQRYARGRLIRQPLSKYASVWMLRLPLKQRKGPGNNQS
ncbi:MAG TPA: hypothetical protein VFV38_42640 [Ktedonobacteraceae bacterium]|nr:hypothetical protein [Ktedonobacteraceae bacterium]